MGWPTFYHLSHNVSSRVPPANEIYEICEITITSKPSRPFTLQTPNNLTVGIENGTTTMLTTRVPIINVYLLCAQSYRYIYSLNHIIVWNIQWNVQRKMVSMHLWNMLRCVDYGLNAPTEYGFNTPTEYGSNGIFNGLFKWTVQRYIPRTMVFTHQWSMVSIHQWNMVTTLQ